MLDNASRDSAASLLRAAEMLSRPMEPLVSVYPEMEIADAYAIQQVNVATRMTSGTRICGHKIGLSSP